MFNISKAFHAIAFANAGSKHERPPDRISQHITVLAEQLVTKLGARETDSLNAFLSAQSRCTGLQREACDAQYQQLWENFQITEPKYSGQRAEGLTSPCGPLDSKIGVILHVLHVNPGQNNKDDNEDLTPEGEPFWNPYSRSIELLLQKGFSDQRTLGLDWHHRIVPKAWGCPKSMWSKDTIACHEAFSKDILNLVPCPFLVVGGACAWNSYLASIVHTQISFEIVPGVALIYALEFEDENRLSLRRIAAKIDHPSYGFKQPLNGQHISLRFDTQCNLMLYLSGQAFNHDAHLLAMKNVKPGRPRSAPLADLWMYRDKEKDRGTALRELDFDSSFFIWARGYIGPQRSKKILEAGESLLEAICVGIQKTLSTRAVLREELGAMQKGLNLRMGFKRTVKVETRSASVQLRTRVHLKTSTIPYDIQDKEAIKKLSDLQMEFKAEFVDVNKDTLPTLGSTLASPTDACYGMRVQIKYEIQRGQQLVPVTLYLTQSTRAHHALCHMNSIADLVMGKSYIYTRSQPPRLTPASWTTARGQKKGSKCTPCQSPECTVCTLFEKEGYHKDVENGDEIWKQ
ncbi:MAG: hypothetical protein GOMPHAMPRED_003372 [Gomphillus americanus]|uniref:Uncharacterized protein n=1 Tax=Gomphillus americanus TaxID=1940652 RepID=A0A8H3EI83_9LECA|nr:MAG: hypothetical protein GOMPHAMPRED_003372 [Gomphillus americanus]